MAEVRPAAAVDATTDRRLLAVVVVYGRELAQVEAWPALCRALAAGAADPAQPQFAQVLVYDNSPTVHARPETADARVAYVHDPANGGTAAAYASAASRAAALGAGWLLLLDQDTPLPDTYFAAAADAISRAGARTRALVPWVLHGDRIVSPARLSRAGSVVPLPRRGAPLDGLRLTAIASGSLVHAAALAQCLPLPPGLWLDYVDHWLFAELQRRGWSVEVIDLALQHDLSIATLDTLGADRLRSILDGEAVFQSGLGWTARAAYGLRLAARVARYARTRPDLAKHTLAWMAKRLARRS